MDLLPLDHEHQLLLDAHRKFIGRLLAESEGAVLSGERADLPRLQSLLDGGALKPYGTTGLQALGVAFGDVLQREAGLEWATISDEYGRDPTLRVPGRTFCVNALTMVSKRVEDGEAVTLLAMLGGVLEAIGRELPHSG